MDGVGNNANNANNNGDEGTPVQTIKLVLFGASRTGKTALLRRFLDNKFEERYVETVEEMYRKGFTIRDRKFSVCFYDMAGSNEFPAMRRVLVGDATGFIITCSADVADSYDQLVNAWQEIATAKRTSDALDKTPCVIVLTKTDQALTDAANLAEKQVLAGKINDWIETNMLAGGLRKKPMLFTEISSKTGSNVKSPFEKLADQLIPRPTGDNTFDGNSDAPASVPTNTIGLLAVNSASSTASPEGTPVAKRGFSLYRRKPTEDKDKDKKLDRAKTSSKSFIFKGSSKGDKAQQQSPVPADDDCCLQ